MFKEFKHVGQQFSQCSLMCLCLVVNQVVHHCCHGQLQVAPVSEPSPCSHRSLYLWVCLSLCPQAPCCGSVISHAYVASHCYCIAPESLLFFKLDLIFSPQLVFPLLLVLQLLGFLFSPQSSQSHLSSSAAKPHSPF